ncbi:ATP-binding protein, partial [Photobacterium phosphoreum]|uniref:ATP-binding protein n=1 Tax=Photobacterium phosphoreum TaxID=659 RepID=UPI000D4DB10A
MKFRILKVEILATDGQNYGYEIKFSEGLNIIRGDNSSGKSTFVNSLIYSLGMEEIIGSKGASSLPYALKKEFECGDRIVKIVNSIVYIEVENKNKKIVTFKRSIISDSDDVKLINIIEGPYLSSNKNGTQFLIKPTFLHDSGSAQDPERGFFAYLEKFIGLSMPSITDNKGKETRLYLQAIFAALIVEQKRGWTDYIANIPYYGVSGVRAKVASFLLDLNVFRNANRIGELNSEKNRIISEWSELVTSIQ